MRILSQWTQMFSLSDLRKVQILLEVLKSTQFLRLFFALSLTLFETKIYDLNNLNTTYLTYIIYYILSAILKNIQIH